MILYHLNINSLKEEQPLEEWLKLVPDFIQEQVLRYRFEKDRLRVLGGKLLIKNAIQSMANLELDQLQKTDKGRLFFKGVDFDFNISHSGDKVVLVFSETNRIGVDIELHRNIGYENFVRNFTPEEWDTIMSANDGKQQFFDFWAIKESVIKADGRGFEVLSKTSIRKDQKVTVCDNKEWLIEPIKVEDGYSSCIAMDRAEAIELVAVESEILK